MWSTPRKLTAASEPGQSEQGVRPRSVRAGAQVRRLLGRSHDEHGPRSGTAGDDRFVRVVGAQPRDQSLQRALPRRCGIAAPLHISDVRVRAALNQSDRCDLNQLDSPGGGRRANSRAAWISGGWPLLGVSQSSARSSAEKQGDGQLAAALSKSLSSCAPNGAAKRWLAMISVGALCSTALTTLQSVPADANIILCAFIEGCLAQVSMNGEGALLRPAVPVLLRLMAHNPRHGIPRCRDMVGACACPQVGLTARHAREQQEQGVERSPANQ